MSTIARLRLRVAAGVCLVALLLAVASVASHARGGHRHRQRSEQIRPDVGLGPVALGESQAAVTSTLGRPAHVAVPELDFRGRVQAALTFDHWHRLDAISTRSHRARTRSGIGPGSSWRTFHHTYPHVHCFRRASQHWSRICTMRSADGRIDTNFLFARRLAMVQIFARGQLARSSEMR